MKFKILVFHQSSEMYGSDLTLYEFLKESDQEKFEFHVVLPDDGPLVAKISPYSTVYLEEVIKVERKKFTLAYLFRFPSDIYKVFKFQKRLKKKIGHFDLIYSNTLAVLGGVVTKSINPSVKHLTHVHEIIEKPVVISKMLSNIFNLFSNFIIFNSASTKVHFDKFCLTSLKENSVVWNGIEDPISANSLDVFKSLPTKHKFNIALVGRINSWKGHLLLIDAISQLPTGLKESIVLHFYGDVYSGNEDFKTQLVKKVESTRLSDVVEFHGFVSSKAFWENINLLVVPSTNPEPFGMVAIEAMSRSIPVIASNHGGITEIIDETCGLKFTPNNAESLAESIEIVLNNADLYAKLSLGARERYLKKFTVNSYYSSLETDLIKVLSKEIMK